MSLDQHFHGHAGFFREVRLGGEGIASWSMYGRHVRLSRWFDWHVQSGSRSLLRLRRAVRFQRRREKGELLWGVGSEDRWQKDSTQTAAREVDRTIRDHGDFFLSRC